MELIDYQFWHTILGNSMPKILICWTVNLAPNTKVLYKKSRIRWGNLRPLEQREYFISTYIPRIVNPCVDAYYFTFELTKSGEVHAHGQCLVYDDPVKQHYWITDIRKMVLQNPLAIQLRNKYANHICYNDRPDEWGEYLVKDEGKHPLTPYGRALVSKA